MDRIALARLGIPEHRVKHKSMNVLPFRVGMVEHAMIKSMRLHAVVYRDLRDRSARPKYRNVLHSPVRMAVPVNNRKVMHSFVIVYRVIRERCVKPKSINALPLRVNIMEHANRSPIIFYVSACRDIVGRCVRPSLTIANRCLVTTVVHVSLFSVDGTAVVRLVILDNHVKLKSMNAHPHRVEMGVLVSITRTHFHVFVHQVLRVRYVKHS
jgi:hypothetical protein